MKKLLILSISFLLVVHLGCSRREGKIIDPNNNGNVAELSGSISGILHKNNSPYFVTKTIKIESSNTLVIEPGVKLSFDDSTYFEINGGLSAIGDPSNPISFTAHNNNWGGIRVINSSQPITIQYAIIENVFINPNDTTDFGAIGIYSSSATIQNSILRKNYTVNGGGLSIKNANAIINNNIFNKNRAVTFGGAILSIESSIDVINNSFYKNDCLNYGGGLVLIDPIKADIQNNIFYKNSANTGDPRISILSGDSTNYNINYNFMWHGDMDPKFISEDNFHLLGDSPCIDAGNPATKYNDNDGSRNNQGAYGGPLGGF